MLIAQLSDLHARPPGRTAYGAVDANGLLRQAVDAVCALPRRPDCVVITGDLTDCGLDEEYALLRETLAGMPMPVFLLPGNHDRPEALARALGDRHPYLPRNGGPLHYVIDDYPVRLIALDSVVPGATRGGLCRGSLEWLERQLARGPARPTILCMHHPPFPIGVDALDRLGCRDGSLELAALVARHPEIERVIAGHHHRPITVRWAGTIGYTAPSTAHQVPLDLRPSEPIRFRLEPPGFALHHWSPDTGTVSHLLPIGDYGPWFDVTLEAEYPGSPGPIPA
jgi:3',5'-cyclic AMP phosphodiesterase CpdA